MACLSSMTGLPVWLFSAHSRASTRGIAGARRMGARAWRIPYGASIQQPHVSPFLVSRRRRTSAGSRHSWRFPLNRLGLDSARSTRFCAFATPMTPPRENKQMKNQKTLRGVFVLTSIRRSAGDTCRTAMKSHREAAISRSSFVSIMAAGIMERPGSADANAALDWNAIATEAFLPTQGADPLESVASLRDAARGHPRCPQRHRATVRVLYPGHGRDAECLHGRSGGRCGARRSGRADPRPASADRCRIRVRFGRDPSRVRQSQTVCSWVRQRRYSFCNAALMTESAEAFATPYLPTGVPGDYTFTPPFDAPPLGPRNSAFAPGWGEVTPFGIDLRRHRLPGPLPIRSAAYAFGS